MLLIVADQRKLGFKGNNDRAALRGWSLAWVRGNDSQLSRFVHLATVFPGGKGERDLWTTYGGERCS